MSNNLFDIYRYDFFDFKVDVKYQYNQYNKYDEDRDFVRNIGIGFDEIMSLKDTNINTLTSINEESGINYSSNKITIDILGTYENIGRSLSRKLTNRITANRLNLCDPSLINEILKFENKNLNYISNNPVYNINFFNNSLTTEDKTVSVYGKIENKSVDKILKSFKNINQNNFTAIKNDFENIKNYSVSNKYFKDVLINKKINQYSYDENLFKYYSIGNNNKSEKVLSEYLTDNYHFENHVNNIINNNDENINNQNDVKEIFEKFKKLKVTPYTFNNALNTFCFPVGFLIKKNIKRNETNEILRNVSSQFIYYDISAVGTNRIVKYDNNISYANYYSYEIQPVFCVSIIENDQNDSPEIVHYLLCQNSHLETWKRAIDYYQPEPPNALQAKYILGTKKILLKWENAVNPQNDIIGYHIYRRSNIFEPYELIKVYVKKSLDKYKNFSLLADNFNINDENLILNLNSDVLKNEFIDEVDNINNLYIYTICSFDAHGLVSNYSNQIAIRYSYVYNRLIVDTISLSNAPRQYPNLYVKRKSILFNNDNLLFNFSPFFKNKSNLKIFFTPDLNEITNDNSSIKLNFENVDYHLNMIRLTDLKSKNIKFNLK